MLHKCCPVFAKSLFLLNHCIYGCLALKANNGAAGYNLIVLAEFALYGSVNTLAGLQILELVVIFLFKGTHFLEQYVIALPDSDMCPLLRDKYLPKWTCWTCFPFRY